MLKCLLRCASSSVFWLGSRASKLDRNDQFSGFGVFKFPKKLGPCRHTGTRVCDFGSRKTQQVREHAHATEPHAITTAKAYNKSEEYRYTGY
eukprot:3353653-Rhodomonas_salina.1